MTVDTESRTPVRDFAPVYTFGGAVAAVGFMLFTALAAASALPGSQLHDVYPTWLRWVLLLAPIPAAVLVYAVLREAEFRTRVDDEALRVRSALGGETPIPWDAVIDYFAITGRPLAEIARTGGSLADTPGEDPAAEPPFARLQPDYTVVFSRGTHVLDPCLDKLGELTGAVAALAPPDAPSRWEEAAWVTCEACRDRSAVSVWPDPSSVDPSEDAAGAQAVACPRCGSALSVELPVGYRLQFRAPLKAPAAVTIAPQPPVEDTGGPTDAVGGEPGGSVPERDEVQPPPED